MKKKVISLFILSIICGVFFVGETSGVSADSEIDTDVEFHNLTNPGRAFTEDDEIQVKITMSSERKLKNIYLSMECVNYEILDGSISFSEPLSSYGIQSDGSYEFKISTMEADTKYTLIYTIRFTGTVGSNVEMIAPASFGYRGTYSVGGIFGGANVQYAGTEIYAAPQKQIQKTSKNLTSVDGTNNVGDMVEYTIVVKNNATNASLWDKINVYDYLPLGMSIDTNTITVNGSNISNYVEKNNGDIIIPLNNLTNGQSATITYRGIILDSAVSKTIINTAEVDTLKAKDNGLYVSAKEKPSVVPDKDDSTNNKTTIMKPSVANPKAASGSTVNTADTTNTSLLLLLMGVSSISALMMLRKQKRS
ncbi:putative repeat protein (TIGR01451 family) [Breznakia sp. PF5-3]|uniref:hypothetical protein n=1 Tax=unclassified Breznakia TaxID=2623764 RepID=UPI00240620E4|nr:MULTISPECIES: hypothetical protein [unclassified Breznakia]MDF9825626.1 putative repeat protein (TIGR01451 family) [Breznakia sp. PM6-1]MDF9836460.1 putative repeat protein (TIGR01451 family) [Breznakia sp. PF5-3]MDF9838627.1 putative repeat protein (TIGR01451 family) [Breznakia sp. PFB2-8]MDF9860658.1 putative repeat protein (TIGR01451 family) [Breznakia sp. PH5-24]